jgi:hypothetical protein
MVDDDPSILFGFGYHGNGVNTATWAGQQLAAWIGSGTKKIPATIPGVVYGLPGRLPLPGLRLQYIKAGIAIRQFLDRRITG